MGKKLDVIRRLVEHIERETCTHDETHRGGAIWEICDFCGQKWSDDRNPKPEFKWPQVVEDARAMLSDKGAIPMTDTEARRKFEEAYQAAIDRGFVSTKRLCWQIWQAALDSVVIDIPSHQDYQGARSLEAAFRVSVQAAGVRTK